MNIGSDILTVKNTKGFLSGKMIFSIASFVFGLVLFFVFIVPEYEKLKILTLEERLRSNNFDKRSQILGKMKSFERRVDNVSGSDLEKIKMFIPADNKVEFQLSNLDILARVMNVELYDLEILTGESASKNNNFSKKEKKGDEKPVKISSGEINETGYLFNIRGSYADILTFIHSIERNVPMLKINEISVSIDKEKAKNNEETASDIKTNKTITANISMSSYNY